jgi:hypothetical protein
VTSRRMMLLLVGLGTVVAGLIALGIDVRATYGAQTTADEPQYLLTALSLYEDGDLDIADELAAERYRDFHEASLPQQTSLLPDGRRISPHDPLLPLLLAVPVGMGGWVGAKLALAMVAGGLAALVAWTAHRRLGAGPGVSVTVAALVSLSPPLSVYATQIYPEIVAALMVTLAIASLLGPGRGRWLGAVAVVALPWLAVKYVPVAAVLAAGLLARSGRRARIRLATWFALSAVLFLMGHLAIYGGLTPYATGDHFVGGEFTAVGAEADLWGRSARLVGLLVDRGFGLAAWQPLYLLLPLVVGWSVARRHPDRGWLVGVVAAGWLTATFAALTMHGWWFPGRQLVVVLPSAALLVAGWIGSGRSRLTLAGGMGAVGVVSFGFLLVAGRAGAITWVVDFAATSDPWRSVARVALPDYMAGGPGTWPLHAVWAVVLVGTGLAGWRRGRALPSAGPAPAGTEQIDERSEPREKVTT